MATKTAGGKKGVRYASKAALKIKEANGGGWDKCGLVKEHVIPASEVNKRVMHELSLLRAAQEEEGTMRVANDLYTLLAKGALALIREDPIVREIEQSIRRCTLLAWITEGEHELLAKNGLTSCMPAGWDGEDDFARYRVCRIDWSEI